MILEPECIGCMLDQVLKALRALKPSINRNDIILTQKKLMTYLLESDALVNPSPIVAKKVYTLISDTLGIEDPYKQLKEESNKLALEYYDLAKELIDSAEDPVFEAIAISALGNTLDYGAHHEMDFINDIQNFSAENLIINDIPEFKLSLEKSDNLLILGDNAGEIVFDKLLVETLRETYPDVEIVFSVREGPIINDATMEDAEAIGLTSIVKVIKAPPTPGLALTLLSDEFKQYICADDGGIVLSKGQGNFESLYRKNLPNKDVFYLLKAKCSLMERIFNVQLGDLIFKKKSPKF